MCYLIDERVASSAPHEVVGLYTEELWMESEYGGLDNGGTQGVVWIELADTACDAFLVLRLLHTGFELSKPNSIFALLPDTHTHFAMIRGVVDLGSHKARPSR
jgi:hypothetical protein